MILGDEATFAVPAGWWTGGRRVVKYDALNRWIEDRIGNYSLLNLPGQPGLEWHGTPNPSTFTIRYQRLGGAPPRAPSMLKMALTGWSFTPTLPSGKGLWESMFGDLFENVQKTALVVGGVILGAYLLRR